MASPIPRGIAETGGMGLTKHQARVLAELQPDATPIQVWQYPMSWESKKGITLTAGVLVS